MAYRRFALMILTSTAAMFVLMYINTYAWEHVFFSETRVYMALLMGAVMAIIMLAYMLGMYRNTLVNIAIFVGAAVAFSVCLWLVRSQATVAGPSYMRAMIPHHSIAIMTSERAQIRDARVEKLADEIIEAQRREIAEMRYLIAEASEGRVVERTYRDPPAEPGTVEDALSNTLIGELDLAPMTEAEADRVLGVAPPCTFRRAAAADPILWAAREGDEAAVELNGVLVALTSRRAREPGVVELSAPGATITVRSAGGAAWRGDADLVLELEQGFRVGYRGFYECSG